MFKNFNSDQSARRCEHCRLKKFGRQGCAANISTADHSNDVAPFAPVWVTGIAGAAHAYPQGLVSSLDGHFAHIAERE
jgi:hypothetical protein